MSDPRPNIKNPSTIINNIKLRMQKGGTGITKGKKKKKEEVISDEDNASEDYSDTENEAKSDYKSGGYHHVNIGETYNNRYIVVKKLGWGYFSTVWLCYDTKTEGFVALKIQKSAKQYREAAMDEIELLKQLSSGTHVVHLIDSFTHRGPNGLHVCFVTEVLGENLLGLMKKYRYGVPLEIVKVIARDVLVGLSFVHEKTIIHTDLKLENILLARPTEDVLQTILNYFPEDKLPLIERKNLDNLSKKQRQKLKKQLNAKLEQEAIAGSIPEDLEKSVQIVKKFECPKIIDNHFTDKEVTPELVPTEVKKFQELYDQLKNRTDPFVTVVDFGNSCWINNQFTEEIQTRQYRSPEVILGQKYSTSADVWSLACLLFELATGEYLFDPRDEKNHDRDEDHLSLMQELLGKIPESMQRGKYYTKYYRQTSMMKYTLILDELKNVRKIPFWPVERLLFERLDFGKEEAKDFAEFLKPMLDWNPSKRWTSKKMLDHPFLRDIKPLTIDLLEKALKGDKKQSSGDDIKDIKDKVSQIVAKGSEESILQGLKEIEAAIAEKKEQIKFTL